MSNMQDTKQGTLDVDRDRRRVEVQTGSRLHFGLLDSVEPFGGLGVMVQSPQTRVTVSGSNAFVCEPEYRERFEEIAKGVVALLGCESLPPIKIQVDSQAEPHCGLGSGTQLSLAAAEASLRFLGVRQDPEQLALEVAQRGKRSAVGIHGYFHGGMIFESSIGDSSALNPIQTRTILPKSWCVAILKPSLEMGQVFGLSEVEKFSTLTAAPTALRDSLLKLATQDVIPAAQRGDFTAFSESLQVYNRTSGELFTSIQGGPYNGTEVALLIKWLVDRGVFGVGQSSWGPGVFAWFESDQHAETLMRRLPVGVKVIAMTHPLEHARVVSEQ